MIALSTNQMISSIGGLTKEDCENTAVARWVTTGVVSAIGFIPVVGWIIAVPSTIALYTLDGICLFKKE